MFQGHRTRWVGLATLAVACGLTPSVGVAASMQIDANVTIPGTDPLSISQTSDLDFGLVNQRGGGTVKINTLGQRVGNGGVALFGSQFHRAEFDVTGAPGFFYTINLPSEPLQFHRHIGSMVRRDTLTVRDLESASENIGAGTVTNQGQLDASGEDSVFVGGTLEVPGSARPGVYRGDLDVTVNY